MLYLILGRLDDNRLWLATEFGGIAVLDLTQRYICVFGPDVRFQLYKSKVMMNMVCLVLAVRCLFQDSFNNIWAGTWGGGINFLKP